MVVRGSTQTATAVAKLGKINAAKASVSWRATSHLYACSSGNGQRHQAPDCQTNLTRRAVASAMVLLGGALVPGFTWAATEDIESLLPSAPRRVEELPSTYVSKAYKLIKALREAIQAEIDGAGEFEVRKKADPAKEIVKDFISSFKSDSAEGQSESYAAISEALRELAAFYKSKGPRAALPSSVSRSILDKLQRAEDSLPPEPKTGLFGF